jgi:O-antigen/teichoic acid export membrane protein
MTGHERDVARSLAISALLNIVLGLALIPGWGAEGAAVAAATSLVVWNIVLAVRVYRKLGIRPTAFGTLKS